MIAIDTGNPDTNSTRRHGVLPHKLLAAPINEASSIDSQAGAASC